jgi:hypothetical protein
MCRSYRDGQNRSPGGRSPEVHAPQSLAVTLGALAFAVTAVPAEAVPVLSLGTRGDRVRVLQTRLADLTYLRRDAVDGHFGAATWHSVVAFQGWNRIGRDGIVGPVTLERLAHPRPLRPWSHRAGFEIHMSEQVLLLVRSQHVRRAVHVSTGAGGATPSGRFRVIRRERLSWSTRFQVWMPYAQYFFRGYAIHEYPSVPTYPASHGCVRLPETEAPNVWAFGRMHLRVWVGIAKPARAAGSGVGCG